MKSTSDDTIDLLNLADTNDLLLSLQSKINSDCIVEHTTLDLPINPSNISPYFLPILNTMTSKISFSASDARGKKLKNKTMHHSDLGGTFSYSLPPLSFLSPVTFTTKKFLYRIVIYDTSNRQMNNDSFGFLLPYALPFDISFRAVIKKENLTVRCVIANTKKEIRLTEENYNKISMYNKMLSRDIFNSTTLKYLAVPLTNNKINFDAINKAEYLSKGNFYDVDIHRKDNENELYFARHKQMENIYEYFDVITAKDSFTKFCDIITMNDINFKHQTMHKYFSDSEKFTSTRTVQDLINIIQTDCPVITTLKSYYEKNIDIDSEYKCNINSIFFYVDIAKKSNDLQIHIKRNGTSSQISTQNRIYLHTLFDISELSYFYMNRAMYQLCIKLPYIMNTFEKLLYPFLFINQIAPEYEKLINETNYKYFQWAFAPPALLFPYNYDTLETLGDTILKFFITSQLIFSSTQSSQSEGCVEKERVKMIKNKYLYKRGKELKIYQYVVSRMNEETMELNDKNISDIVEATIAAFYLIRRDIKDGVWFIHKCDIDAEIRPKAGSETMRRIAEKFQFAEISQEEREKIKKDISFKELAMMYQIGELSWDIQTKEKDIEELEKIIGYRYKDKEHLHRAFRHLSCNPTNYSDNYEKFELLGDSIVEVYIIIFIFTVFIPFLYNDDNSDDILIKNAKNFDCYSATKIKSFLCSNTFMCKLSYILTLPLFFEFSPQSVDIKNQLAAFLHYRNVNLITTRNLNDYEPPASTNPKFIADIFEALIGSIYIDGTLSDCFKVLERIYRPYVIYCAFYFDDLKYSAINDFSYLCTNKFKTAPEFRARNNGNEEIVDIYIAEKLLYSGRGKSQEEAKSNAAMIALKDIAKRKK